MNYEDIDHLLPRYCEGLATEEECRQVESWMEESEDNRKIVDQINTLYIAVDTVNVMRKVDTEKALKKVSSRMIVRKTTWWEWMQRVAAILFIPLSVAFLVQYMHNGKSAVCQMMEIKTNPGMTTSVVLPDSTVVYLNSESSLRYPSVFEGDIRNVELKGEAYFAVAKDLKKKFVVSAPHSSQIEVLGTHFNVEAYEDEPDVSTTLVEGQVCFHFSDKDYLAKKVVMKPGQRLVYSSTNGDVQLYATSCLSETAWKDGKIIFNNTPLDVALRMLEKRFNVTFKLKNARLKTNAFTGTFTEQRFERILEYFKISSKIQWRYLESPDIRDERSIIEVY